MIRLLPPDVAERIAAGEVIERPASVVKELVENSLDAGASSLTIEIAQAGKRMIRVVDDGAGIPFDELPLAVQRHATSKIATFDDLAVVRTLGFRGEGLSSIASVSRVRITSRTPDEELAGELLVDSGICRSHRRTAYLPGTTVEVSDLFYNTPARLKFLRSDTTERAHIIRTLEEYAVAYPEVAFTLTIDGKRIFSMPRGQAHLQRIGDLFGHEAIAGLVPLSRRESARLQFDGYVSEPTQAPLNRRLQMFFVNRRPVSVKTLSQALYDAYRDCLPVGRHPACILFITADPVELDVNVHPTKRVVRFRREQQLFSVLRDTVRSTISVVPRAVETLRVAEPVSPYGAPATAAAPPEPIATDIRIPGIPAAVAESHGSAAGTTRLFADFRYLGQIGGTYLLFSVAEDLVLIDQHAAHERVLYERFIRQGGAGVQRLLVPVTLELTPLGAAVVQTAVEELARIGVEVIVTGERTVALTALPSLFAELDAAGFLERLADALVRDEGSTPEAPATRERIIRAACRAAVKARDLLTPVDVERLVHELEACEQPFTCPHGRPTVRRLSRTDLERLFLRT